jgi:hypothetical protein
MGSVHTQAKLGEAAERVHENQQQILAQEQKKPESSLAKKISGFQNERAAKIGVLNDTVKEEICRIARLDRSDHRARGRAMRWPSAARSSSVIWRNQG